MRPSFVLRNIAAVNFYLYGQDFPTESLGNTVFLGSNGSGKSVLLDAIQIVMTAMNKNYLDLNSRVSEGKRNTRTVREACLGLLDDGKGYEREGCLTYIALGFETSDGTKRCTAGVCLEAKASLDEETVLGLFIAEDVILRFGDFVNGKVESYEEKPWLSFLDEQRRKGHTVHTYARQNGRAFLRQLYAIINANARGTQLDPDRARAAMRQALSFDIDQINSVTEFVQRFLLDEAPIEVEIFQERYATWREMQKNIARTEAEIKQVESIRSQCERVLEDQFNTRYWAYGFQRAEYDRLAAVIGKQQQEILQKTEELESLRAYQASVANSIEEIRLRHDAVMRQIDGTPAYEQIKQAQAEWTRQDAARKVASVEAKTAFDALTALRGTVTSPSFPASKFPALIKFTSEHLSTAAIGEYGAGWPDNPASIAKLVSSVPDLSAVRGHVEGMYREAASQAAQMAKELDDIERHLRNLRSGGAYMSEDTEAFLEDLKRLKVPAQSLSEVADIAPGFAEWRGIIEAILSDWCDAVIVEPRHMNQAYRHFDANYKGKRAKLVQSENTSTPGARAGTLAEAVTTDNGYARAFIDARLGRIVRARYADDIRKGDLAASADGKYAHGRGIEYRRLPAIPRLGKSVRDQQIAQLTRNKEAFEPRLRAAKDGETRLFVAVDALKRAYSALVSGRESTLVIFAKISTADLEMGRQTELIAQLEAKLPKGLMDEKRRLEDELTTYKNEERNASKQEEALDLAIKHRQWAIDENRKNQSKVGALARESVPGFPQRRPRHEPPIGLERFARRARGAYRRELAVQSDPARLRLHFETLQKEKRQGRHALVMRLSNAIQDYVQANPDHHPGFEWTRAIGDEQTTVYDWISLRHRHLTETVLRNYTAQVDKAVAALVETMVHDFLSRLRSHIESVDRIKDDLNRALLATEFMGEVYQIRQERDQDKETIRYLIDRLDIIGPKATALLQREPDRNDPDQVKIRELIDMLTFESDDDAAHRRRLRELADYRKYFRFSIDICDPKNGFRKISDLDQRRGKASGGQKFVPFYICLGVAAASAYHNHVGDLKKAPPQSALLLMDEAFEKLDPENIYKIIRFYKDRGLQLIMAAPKTHQALYQETFNTLISIVRVDRAIYATAQHFHPAAHELLRAENPMHKPRRYFEELVRDQRDNAAE